MAQDESERRSLLTLEGKQSVVDPVDEAVIGAAKSGEGLIRIETAEQLRALGEAAAATRRHFEHWCSVNLTIERYAEIRRLRCDLGYSWRAVAHECNDRWGGDWGSNQIMGMALCEAAARHYGEDYMAEPWN